MITKNFDFGGLLASFIQEYQRFERELCKKHGFYPGQPPVLVHIMNQEGLLLKDLSKKSGLGMPTLSVSIRNLEKAGFLYRLSDPNDSRAFRIYLTEKGRTQTASHHLEMETFLNGLLNQVGEENMYQLGKGIEVFRDYILDYK